MNTEELENIYEAIVAQRETGSAVRMPTAHREQQAITELLELESNLKAAGKTIHPRKDLLARILHKHAALVRANTYNPWGAFTHRSSAVKNSFGALVKKILALTGTVLALAAVAAFIFLERTPAGPIATAPSGQTQAPHSSEQTPPGIAPPESTAATTLATSNDELDAILASMDETTDTEAGVATAHDTAATDSIIISEDTSLNPYDQETSVYVAQL